jgi:hypothetical protein
MSYAACRPSALDVATNFAERWNDQNCYLTDGFPSIQPPLAPIPLPQPNESSAAVGSHAVQVLRTFGCAYTRGQKCFASFAPQGEVCAQPLSRLLWVRHGVLAGGGARRPRVCVSTPLSTREHPVSTP